MWIQPSPTFTTLGATPEHRSVRVLQLGAAATGSLAWKRFGGVLDVVDSPLVAAPLAYWMLTLAPRFWS